MAQCLGSPADFGKMWRASGCDELASTHVPIIIHEDGVPHFSGAMHCFLHYTFQHFFKCKMCWNSRIIQKSCMASQRPKMPQIQSYIHAPKFVPEVAQPQFGAGALAVCGVTLGKSSMPSQSWAHRMSLKILGLRSAGF